MRFEINGITFTTENTIRDYVVTGSDGWYAFCPNEHECQKVAIKHVMVAQSARDMEDEEANSSWDIQEEGRNDYNMKIRY